MAIASAAIAPAVIVTAALVLSLSAPCRADVDLGAGGKLKLTGDLRLRLEEDWNSVDSAGVPRQDRGRARLRARLGLQYLPTDSLTVGLRLRSGSQASQQSPHITFLDFNNNDTGSAEFGLDQWYLRYAHKGFKTTAGRQSFPFWKQNELFWDDDVTPAGVSASGEWKAGACRFTLNGGYFSLPDGNERLSGNLGAGQAVWSLDGKGWGVTVAGGLFLFDGSPKDARHSGALNLRNGNGARDYAIWSGSAQLRIPNDRWPVKVGADWMHNSESYHPNELAADPFPTENGVAFTLANRDETDGYVGFASAGKTEDRGDWLFAWYYAHIETLAVNASFAEDDWVRFGSATQTDGSDIKGHEGRVVYALSKKMNLMARLYLVRAISTRQDGNRFRLDFNLAF